MNKDAHVGLTVRCLHHKIGREIANISKKQYGESTTPLHGLVVRHLYDNRDKDVFQKDLEEAFLVRPSTVSKAIKLMEKKELISRESMVLTARVLSAFVFSLLRYLQKRLIKKNTASPTIG